MAREQPKQEYSQAMQGILAALHKELHGDKDALRAWREKRARERMAADREKMAADRAADLTLLRKTLVPREGAPPTYARALLEAMREKGYEGTEQDLGYLLKRAFRAHPAVKKAKRGKKGVRWQGLAVAAETRPAPRVTSPTPG